MDRDNATWLAQLRGDGPEKQAALSDLRAVLVRGLRGALAGRAPADEAFLEDAAQDALVRMLDRLGQFEGRSRFVTWALSIAIHTAMSELRRRRWRDVSLDEVTADAERLPHGAPTIEATGDVHFERRAILQALHEAIRDALTDRQRAALVAELQGMPQEQIAQSLGSNRNALYKLTHDARKRLKRALETAGYGAADIGAAFAD